MIWFDLFARFWFSCQHTLAHLGMNLFLACWFAFRWSILLIVLFACGFELPMKNCYRVVTSRKELILYFLLFSTTTTVLFYFGACRMSIFSLLLLGRCDETLVCVKNFIYLLYILFYKPSDVLTWICISVSIGLQLLALLMNSLITRVTILLT